MIINQTIHIELAPEGPKIIDGYWHEWVNGEWVNTGRKAEGEDGTGILDVVDWYAISTDGVNPPGTGWQTTLPAKPANYYLWNYEVITYTDGRTPTQTQKRVIQGKDARSIYDIKNAYAYSASDTVSPTSGWQYSIAALGAKPAGYFLWVREDIAYTDNPSNYISTTGYVVRDGEDGKDAVAPIIINGHWAFWDETIQDYVESAFSAIGDDGHSPYVDGNTGTWWEWNDANGTYQDTGFTAEGKDGEDGYSVSLSKSEHTFNYDKNGNQKGSFSDGVVSVEVMKGTNALICDSLGVLSPTVNDTYRVTAITQNPASTFSYNVDRPNNVFRLIPVDMTVDEVELTFTIVARTNDNNTTFTRKIKYQKHKDGEDGIGEEFIFKANDSDTTPPVLPQTTDEGYQDDDYHGDWSDDPVAPTEVLQFVWVAKRKKVGGVWEAFGTPSIWTWWVTDGGDAAYWELRSSAPLIYKDAEDASTSGVHTTITLSGRYVEGVTSQNGGYISAQPNGGVEDTPLISPREFTPPNNAGVDEYVFRLYDNASKTTLLDTLTVPIAFKGEKGVSAINITLSNEADALPASTDGVVTDYTGSGTIIRVFEGSQDLSYGTGNGRYQVSASGSNISPNSMPTTNGNARVYGNASSMGAAATAVITFVVSGKTFDGESFSFDKVQNFTKSERGDSGEDGITISPNQQGYTYRADLNGDIIGPLANGMVELTITSGSTPITCPSSISGGTPTTNGTYRVTRTLGNGITANSSLSGGKYRITPATLTVDEASVELEIKIMMGGVVTSYPLTLTYRKQFDGADGKSTEFIFKGDTSDTIAPTLPYTSQQDDWYGQGTANEWNDDLVEPTKALPYVWASQRKKVDGVWGAFTTPKVWLRYAEDGDGIVSTTIEYAKSSSGTAIPTEWSTSIPTPTKGWYLWTRTTTVYKTSPTTVAYSISYWSEDGEDGDGVVHIYKQYPTKPATPSSGVANPTGWSRNPDYILSIVSQTNWAVNGKWHQSEELTATGNSTTSRITFTTAKDAQTITLELWADGHATYDYVYAGNLDTAASTSNYYDRVRGGRIIITYDVPTAGNHYIDIFWRKGISTIVGSNRGYYAIISDVKVWRSTTNVVGGVFQDWSEPQQFFIDSALEERVYCLSKTTTAPAISDSDAHISDYIPLPCSLSSYRGDFTTYRAYSIGQVVRYQFEYYKVVKTITSASTRYPTDEEYFEKIPGWTDNPIGANKDYPFEFVAIRKKQSDGLWGPYVTSVWSNYGIGTNYIPMGWWDPSVTYRMTDLGIPLIKKADGTALGYSVYTLKVAASTPGFFFPPEWDLVESADFIYMQQAYIERLQAEIITADRINAMDITSKRVLALDANNNKVASMNEFGDGAYIQYYPSGRKRMEFGGGLIIYYSDNSFNTELWTLGQSGSIHSSSLDRWGEVYFVATDTNGTNVKKQVLPGGVMYKEFKPGSGSVYTSYLGLTVKNTVNSSTTPDNVSSSSYIPTGWYTKPSVAMRNQDDPPYTFRRTLVYFSNGKQTTSKEIVFTDYGDGLPTE